MSIEHNKHIDEINQAIKEILLRHMPSPDIAETAIPKLSIAHRIPNNGVERCFSEPVCSFIVQGSKRCNIGHREYLVHANQCLVCAVDMPSASYILTPQGGQPFLTFFFTLDREILLDLVMHMNPEDRPHGNKGEPAYVEDSSPEFMRCLLRLVELLDKPSQIPVMAPLIFRELHYLLLITPRAAALQNLFRTGSLNNQIMEAISIMRKNIATPLRVDYLARLVNMSVSSLHRHFKNVTGFSPLQYHKNLRLHEAQRLMLMENQGAASAAMSVGYESPTQFSREYKRLFGEPPHRDISRKRLHVSVM